MRIRIFPTLLKPIVLIASFLFYFSLVASTPIPPAPPYYVLDQSQTLNENALHAIESLLVEHDRLTNEQLMIGVFNPSPSGDIAQWSQQVIEAWKIGKRESKNNGLLLTIFWDVKKAEIEVGFSLDSVFPREKQKEILSNTINPYLRRGKLKSALALGTYRVLEALNSPLVQSGQALQILKTIGINPNDEITPETFSWGGTIFLFTLGLLTLGIILNEILSREAHFTESGWYRTRPFHWVRFLIKKKGNMPSSQTHGGGISGSW